MDIHTFEQLSGTEAGSVHEVTADDIEMERHEGFKESRPGEAKRQDGT